MLPKHYKIYSDYRAHGLLLEMLSMIFDTFSNTVHKILNIEPQIEKIVLQLYKTIQYMKWPKLFLVDLTLKCLTCVPVCLCGNHYHLHFATSRIIIQYFNHLLLYSFIASPLKVDEPSSTFQL